MNMSGIRFLLPWFDLWLYLSWLSVSGVGKLAKRFFWVRQQTCPSCVHHFWLSPGNSFRCQLCYSQRFCIWLFSVFVACLLNATLVLSNWWGCFLSNFYGWLESCSKLLATSQPFILSTSIRLISDMIHCIKSHHPFRCQNKTRLLGLGYSVSSYRSVAGLHTRCWPAHPFPRRKRSPWIPGPSV